MAFLLHTRSNPGRALLVDSSRFGITSFCCNYVFSVSVVRWSCRSFWSSTSTDYRPSRRSGGFCAPRFFRRQIKLLDKFLSRRCGFGFRNGDQCRTVDYNGHGFGRFPSSWCCFGLNNAVSRAAGLMAIAMFGVVMIYSFGESLFNSGFRRVIFGSVGLALGSALSSWIFIGRSGKSHATKPG